MGGHYWFLPTLGISWMGACQALLSMGCAAKSEIRCIFWWVASLFNNKHLPKTPSGLHRGAKSLHTEWTIPLVNWQDNKTLLPLSSSGRQRNIIYSLTFLPKSNLRGKAVDFFSSVVQIIAKLWASMSCAVQIYLGVSLTAFLASCP